MLVIDVSQNNWRWIQFHETSICFSSKQNVLLTMGLRVLSFML